MSEPTAASGPEAGAAGSRPARHSEKPPLGAPADLGEARTVLESLEREIAFYRRRSGQVYFFGSLVEVLILAGQQKISLPAGWSWQTSLVYSIFFVAVAIVGILLGSEYRRRIHILKDSRVELLAKIGYRHVFPTASEQRISEIQVLYFVLIFLSLAGIGAVWLNPPAGQPAAAVGEPAPAH